MGKGRDHAALNRTPVARLLDLRLAVEMTQADLANTLGKSQSYASKVERGERLLEPVELSW